MTKLTKKRVEQLDPRADGDFVVWDSELHGFGVRVWPSGKRTYIAKYRTREGRQRKMTLGQHSRVTAEQARAQAVQVLSAAAAGKDPAQTRSDFRNNPTVAVLADRYIEDHARPKKGAKSLWRTRPY